MKVLLTALVSWLTICAGPALASCNTALPEAGVAFTGTVTRIFDGDSLCVDTADGGIKVRLADFNAIDRVDPGGRSAKQELYDLAYDRYVTCTASGKSLERVIARCMIERSSIGDLMRERGVPEGGAF